MATREQADPTSPATRIGRVPAALALCAAVVAGAASPLLRADGKFVRGEPWQKFIATGASADFYVAENGDDRWSGTLAQPNGQGTDGPFATLARAQRAVRELKQQVYRPKTPPVEQRWIGSPHPLGQGKDILVQIRGGFYALAEPLQFLPEDGGERCETDLPSGAFEYHALKDHYVTYAAYPGETPILSGASAVGPWRREGDRWATQVVGGEVTGLLAEGVSLTLARAPNEGYFTPAEFPVTTTAFRYRPGDLEAWPELAGNRIVMLLRWHTGRNSMVRIDAESRTVHLQQPQPGLVVVPPRYYVENLEALLDAPGEWHFAPASGKLSFHPPADLPDPNQARLTVPRLSHLLRVSGTADRPVRNLRFYGLTFEGTTAGGSALTLAYAHACEVVASHIRNVAGEGVRLDPGCYQTRILENAITRTGGSGIVVAGVAHPAKWTDSIRETRLTHNTLSFCGGAAISDHDTLFSTIAHNAITQNLGRTAISVGGWRNLEEALTGGYRVEYNHLYQVQECADDSGAITTSGLTHDSFVSHNLIHQVRRGYFNDNVAIWFDNMSSGWVAENNVFYGLAQGEMKLCAANLVDNLYRDNFVIEPPAIAPEPLLLGVPDLAATGLAIRSEATGSDDGFLTGQYLVARAELKNRGATGVSTVHLFVDGRRNATQKVASIRGNDAHVEFRLRFATPGLRRIAIEDSPTQTIDIRGEPWSVLADELALSESVVPAGTAITASARLENVGPREATAAVALFLNGEAAESRRVTLAPGEAKPIAFQLTPAPGRYRIRIGNTPESRLHVYAHRAVALTTRPLDTHVSATAGPAEFQVDTARNRYRIQASGTDLLHAEDSYGTIYLRQGVRGNFVSTVKVVRFSERTHEWFRAGLFVRNDLAQSFGAEPGSLGSVLCFTTPGRTGLQWDEFGDGCMHKASSQNHPRTEPYPMWLRLARQGDRFSSAISYDGITWTGTRQTGPVPGLAEVVDLGLAAGACDQRAYAVEFADWTLEVEAEPTP